MINKGEMRKIKEKDKVLYFDPKTIFAPPPSMKMIFFLPLVTRRFFYSYRALFALILPYQCSGSGIRYLFDPWIRDPE
jgi:hypothetical protein